MTEPKITRAEVIQQAGELAAEHDLAIAQMTPREQAEAAWTPTSSRSVDEIEDSIRIGRGLPPLDRSKGGGAGEDRHGDGT